MKGYSLHIGLNAVNPIHYDGWSGELNFAEDDASAMYNIARKQKFDYSQILPTPMATRKRVLSEIRSIAQKAESGDLVFISYSGHGARMPALNGTPDATNETWCCHDGMVIDKELLFLWRQFKSGVRIVVVSDSCHSGDIVRVPEDIEKQALERGAKFLPMHKSLAVFNKNSSTYKRIMKKLPVVDDTKLAVRVKQIGGCAVDKFSYEGDGNGELTLAINAAFDKGAFKGDYSVFFTTILKKMATNLQMPVLLNIGAADLEFDKASPFYVEPTRNIAHFFNPTTVIGETHLLVDFEESVGKVGPSVKSAISKSDYTIGTRKIAVFTPTAKIQQNPWDAAHQLYDELKAQGVPAKFVEPEMNMQTGINEVSQHNAKIKGESIFLETWPHPEGRDAFDPMWHLGTSHSQLAEARDSLMNDPIFMGKMAENPIRIAHIDTGFFPFKDFIPTGLDIGLSKSFVPGETQNLGFDFQTKGIMPEQQGHGAATLAILAGPEVNSPKGLDGYKGYIGAIPFAKIICIRIQDSVALLKTRAFEQAVYYAVEQGCEVITMSMAGAPSRRWAEAVNYAYEKGVTIVSAAGNSWREGLIEKRLPKYLLFPARFERVIGATGVTYSQQPYIFDANNWEETRPKTAGGINMQGNYGPDEQMHHVMAAYTPNVCWAETGETDKEGKKIKPPKPYFIMTGGGTSSATPQIAAAAALWIAKHHSELANRGYKGTWQQVEAVRAALFSKGQNADKAFKTYNGRGALRALDSLQVAPFEANDLTKSKTAETPFFPLIQTLFGLLKSNNVPLDKPKQEMLALELAQLVVTEPDLNALGAMDFTSDALTQLTDEQTKTLTTFLAKSSNASSTLKTAFGV